MTKKDGDLFSTLIALVLIPFIVVLRGWVLSVAWKWFCVPLGAPAIGKAHAIGIALLIAMLTERTSGKKDDDSDKTALWYAIVGILQPLFSLFLAWLTHVAMVS